MARSSRAQSVATVTELSKAPTSRRRSSKPPVAVVVEATGSEVERYVAGMEMEHIQCRDFGHSWRPFHARIVREMNCIKEELRCQRCTTVRTRLLGMRGQLLESKYDYVEGYTVKGMGRLTGSDRDVIRLASVRHLLKADTVAE